MGRGLPKTPHLTQKWLCIEMLSIYIPDIPQKTLINFFFQKVDMVIVEILVPDHKNIATFSYNISKYFRLPECSRHGFLQKHMFPCLKGARCQFKMRRCWRCDYHRINF